MAVFHSLEHIFQKILSWKCILPHLQQQYPQQTKHTLCLLCLSRLDSSNQRSQHSGWTPYLYIKKSIVWNVLKFASPVHTTSSFICAPLHCSWLFSGRRARCLHCLGIYCQISYSRCIVFENKYQLSTTRWKSYISPSPSSLGAVQNKCILSMR